MNFYHKPCSSVSQWVDVCPSPWFPEWSVCLQAQRGSRGRIHRPSCESLAESTCNVAGGGGEHPVRPPLSNTSKTSLRQVGDWDSFTCSKFWRCPQRRRGPPGYLSWRPACAHRCGGLRAWGEPSYWPRGSCLKSSGCRSRWCCSAAAAPPSAHHLHRTGTPPIWEEMEERCVRG